MKNILMIESDLDWVECVMRRMPPLFHWIVATQVEKSSDGLVYTDSAGDQLKIDLGGISAIILNYKPMLECPQTWLDGPGLVSDWRNIGFDGHIYMFVNEDIDDDTLREYAEALRTVGAIRNVSIMGQGEAGLETLYKRLAAL